VDFCCVIESEGGVILVPLRGLVINCGLAHLSEPVAGRKI